MSLLEPEDVRPDHRVVGCTGGLPDMPADAPWEAGHYFVADVDLSAVPWQRLGDGLPREGHLLLFYVVDYSGFEDEDPAPVVYVPPGTPTAVRPAPAYNFADSSSGESARQGLINRKVLVLDSAVGWDVLDWKWTAPEENNEEWNEEEREWIAQLGAAIEEYRTCVGETPVVKRNTEHLGGVELNPQYWRADYGQEFLRRREEAVITLRDEPHRFDELYALALEQASKEKDGPWVNLLEFSEAWLLDDFDGEMGWVITRQDLLAQRFDRVRHSHFA